ncbi:hypothetical protein RKD35_006153 [Streptomyces albogriseolus]
MSADCVGVGAIVTVGSTVTGYWRSGAASHSASGFRLMPYEPFLPDSTWRTASVPVVPYGEPASCFASVMNGAGITSAGAPTGEFSPYSEMVPFFSDLAVRPLVVSVNSKEGAPFGRSLRTMSSFTLPLPTV